MTRHCVRYITSAAAQSSAKVVKWYIIPGGMVLSDGTVESVVGAIETFIKNRNLLLCSNFYYHRHPKPVHVLYCSSFPEGKDLWYISGSACSPRWPEIGPKYKSPRVAASIEKFIKKQNQFLSSN